MQFSLLILRWPEDSPSRTLVYYQLVRLCLLCLLLCLSLLVPLCLPLGSPGSPEANIGLLPCSACFPGTVDDLSLTCHCPRPRPCVPVSSHCGRPVSVGRLSRPSSVGPSGPHVRTYFCRRLILSAHVSLGPWGRRQSECNSVSSPAISPCLPGAPLFQSSYSSPISLELAGTPGAPLGKRHLRDLRPGCLGGSHPLRQGGLGGTLINIVNGGASLASGARQCSEYSITNSGINKQPIDNNQINNPFIKNPEDLKPFEEKFANGPPGIDLKVLQISPGAIRDRFKITLEKQHT